MTDVITVWMDSLANRKDSTRKMYQQQFTQFCEWAGKTPDELRQLKFQEDQKEKPFAFVQTCLGSRGLHMGFAMLDRLLSIDRNARAKSP